MSHVPPSEYASVDFRRHPEQYRIGRGDEGALTVEPYKSELLPLLRFKTPEIARMSARNLLTMFEGYRTEKDFVGMDMARKFLEMGWTRAKLAADERPSVLSTQIDPEKEAVAREFYAHLRRAAQDPYYLVLLSKHRRLHG
jgi:hypothetical protein